MSALWDASKNRGSRFTQAERKALGLEGLLPWGILPLDVALRRVMKRCKARASDLERYEYLMRLLELDRELFFAFAAQNIAYVLPLIYTPVVGEACLVYDEIVERPRGLHISRFDRGRIDKLLDVFGDVDVRICVVTDGQRILGLGDLGANGMGIPVGKLLLYTICAGVPPGCGLPVMLDVGTDNSTLRERETYLGVRESRLQGEEYDELVDEFVLAVQNRWPRCLLHWEDFGRNNSFRVLSKYREKVCSFNDDIQGTATVCLAALLSAVRGRFLTSLESQRILFYGAGQAAIGIASLVVLALEKLGLDGSDALSRIAMLDAHGLVCHSREDLSNLQRQFAQPLPMSSNLLEIIDLFQPTILIGVSGRGGAFSEAVCRKLSDIAVVPVIFALSNPSTCCECTAEEAVRWTEGRAVFASGSPFGVFSFGGKEFCPSQVNNAYVFPALGLACVESSTIRTITDEMFYAAAVRLAAATTERDWASGGLLPPLSSIREISVEIAHVIRRASS